MLPSGCGCRGSRRDRGVADVPGQVRVPELRHRPVQHAEVVLGFDGSYSGAATDVVRRWEPPEGVPG
jgi:hypothetical protein